MLLGLRASGSAGSSRLCAIALPLPRGAIHSGRGGPHRSSRRRKPPVPARRCPGFEAQADLTFIVFLLDSLPATSATTARLAQSAERKALNLVVVGSSPTVGASCLMGRQGSPGGAMQRHAARVRVPPHVSRSGSRAARARRYLEHARSEERKRYKIVNYLSGLMDKTPPCHLV